MSLPLLPDPWPWPQGGPADSTHRHCLQHQRSQGYQSAFQTKPPFRDLGSPSFCLPRGQLCSPPLRSIFTHKGPPLSRDRGCCLLHACPCFQTVTLPSLLPSSCPHRCLPLVEALPFTPSALPPAPSPPEVCPPTQRRFQWTPGTRSIGISQQAALVHSPDNSDACQVSEPLL